MAKLYFYYSTMNAGKSTALLQAAYNYAERGMATRLFTARLDDRAVDVRPHGIVSRDRERGYHRFLFAKPVSVTGFYGQAFAIAGAGLLSGSRCAA